MFVIRWVLGRIILFFNFIFSPKSVKRSPSEQKEIDEKTQGLSLYQLPACPFCVKVRREIKRKGLNIDLKDINGKNNYLDELVSEGGKRTVPCLKIINDNKETQWLYESKDIINYLQQFAK